jgi:hypothetical protein
MSEGNKNQIGDSQSDTTPNQELPAASAFKGRNDRKPPDRRGRSWLQTRPILGGSGNELE